MLRLVHALKESKEFDMSVCSFMRWDGDLGSALREEGVRTVYLKGKFNALSFVKLFRMMRRERFDVLHTFTPYPNVVGRILGKCARISLVISSVDSVVQNLRPTDRFLEKVTSGLSDVILCISKTSEQSFRKYVGSGGTKVMTIHNYVDLDAIDGLIRRNGRSATRAQLGVDENEYVICSLGRFEPVKDQRTLLRAFEIVSKELPEAHLWLIGFGSMENELRGYAARLACRDKIRFFVRVEDSISILGAADVFVLPSIHEGMSGALLEAMAAREPAIVTRIEQNLEAVVEGESCLAFNVGDHISLARQIVRLFKEPEKARSLALKARKSVEEGFSARHAAEAHARLYRSVRHPLEKTE